MFDWCFEQNVRALSTESYNVLDEERRIARIGLRYAMNIVQATDRSVERHTTEVVRAYSIDEDWVDVVDAIKMSGR